MANEEVSKGGSKPISLEDLETDVLSAEELNQQAEQVSQAQTPVVETPKVEEPVVEQPVVEKPQEQPQEPVPEPEQPVEQQFSFEFFNKTVGKEYKSLEEIKADLERPTMESEYKEAQTKLSDLETKNKDLQETNQLLMDQLDPSTYFSSDDAMKLEIFKKENPKKDASIAQKVFSTQDLSSIDDLEMVKMGRKFKNPKLPGTDADLEAAIKEELGLDSDTPRGEWPSTAQIRLASMAGDYRDVFEQLRDSVKTPERMNIEELKAQRKQEAETIAKTLNDGWTRIAEETLKETSKLRFPVGEPKEGEEQQFFEWDLGESPKEDIENVKKDFIDLGIDPSSDEAKESFQKALNLTLLDRNLPKMMKQLVDDQLARQKEEFLKQTHNPVPLTDSQRTEESGSEKEMRERTAFATGGIGSALYGHPLFKFKT